MPDDARSLLRGLSDTQPFDNATGGAILLITADHLHTLTGISIHKNSAGSQHIQQCVWRKKPLNQSLLFTFDPKRRLVGAAAFRPDILPRRKMLVARRNRAELSLFAACPNQEEVGVKQARLPFSQA